MSFVDLGLYNPKHLCLTCTNLRHGLDSWLLLPISRVNLHERNTEELSKRPGKPPCQVVQVDLTRPTRDLKLGMNVNVAILGVQFSVCSSQSVASWVVTQR